MTAPTTYVLALSAPRDVALSADGSTLYAAGKDGVLRAYSMSTGGEIGSWTIGSQLGGIDLSPDGMFLMIAEEAFVGAPGGGIILTAYRFNVATQGVQAYSMTTSEDFYGAFFDLAVLSDGRVLLDRRFGGYSKILDLQTGQYSDGPWIYDYSILSAVEDGSKVLIADGSGSPSRLVTFQPSGTVTMADYTEGYNWGVQAISGATGYVAQWIYNQGIRIYNSSLQHQITLETWKNGSAEGLTFDETGQNLFILDDSTDSIVQVAVSDWSVVRTIPIGTNVGRVSGQVATNLGNKLLLDPTGSFFTVLTQTGLVAVANPAAPERIGTIAPDSITGSMFSDRIDGGDGNDTISGAIGDDMLAGGEGDDLLLGDAGNDLLIAGSGTDHLYGGEGNDVLYFGAAFAGDDRADGGAGRDALVLQGSQTVFFGEASLAGIESLSIQSGANAKFGDTANNFYDYKVVTADGNVAAGVQLIVNASSLRAGEDFTFDGSSEHDGRFLVYGGFGIDILKGGDGNDIFFFEGGRWGPTDTVDGGAGRDSLVISGSSGVNHIEFAATSFTGIESISLNNHLASDPSSTPSYELVLHNDNVAPGGTLIVNGNSLTDPAQSVSVDGHAVTDGNLTLFAGAGNDTLIGGAGADLLYGAGGRDLLTGGAGADIFQYRATPESASADPDSILDFQPGLDKIDLRSIDADTNAAGDQAFHWIGGNAFGGLGAASAGELRLFDTGGYQRIEGDTDGDGLADLVIVVNATAPLGQGDFLL